MQGVLERAGADREFRAEQGHGVPKEKGKEKIGIARGSFCGRFCRKKIRYINLRFHYIQRPRSKKCGTINVLAAGSFSVGLFRGERGAARSFQAAYPRCS